MSDKRQTKSSAQINVSKKSERGRHYCKYCYKNVPTFVLEEDMPNFNVSQRMRCCYECGSGLEIIDHRRVR